jgi:hypothetical protein
VISSLEFTRKHQKFSISSPGSVMHYGHIFLSPDFYLFLIPTILEAPLKVYFILSSILFTIKSKSKFLFEEKMTTRKPDERVVDFAFASDFVC